MRPFEPQPQELVLTLAGAYLRPRERAVWSGGLVSLLGEFGFSGGAARVALTRLVQRELLARQRDGRLVHYTLTPRAAAVLADGDRRIFRIGTEPAREQCWTVLWHAVPEDRRRARERLVRRLRFLGFGPVQDGTWVAPHDRTAEASALLAELDLTRHAGLLLGAPAGDGDTTAFLARAWDLDALARRYAEFAAEFGGYRTARSRSALTDAAAFGLRTRLVHTFRQFPFLDPELPAAPSDRAAAVRLFHQLYDALAAQAQRHFDEVTTP